jgi:two-component system sensor histidine kinase KdpD
MIDSRTPSIVSAQRWFRLHGPRRDLGGIAVALVGVAILTTAMVPLRHHMSPATPALVLVLPVALGAVVGGFRAGSIGVVVGFLASDFFFVPPYDTIQIGAARNWVALFVYVLVVVLIARLVAYLRETQLEAQRHAEATQRILDLSDALISDRPFKEFLRRVTSTFLEAFDLQSVVLLLPVGNILEVASTAGAELTVDELSDIIPTTSAPRRPSAVHLVRGSTVIVPLSTTAGPLGLLALVGTTLQEYDRGLFQTYANQVALALERAQLREKAIKSQLFEEVDRWRDALIGAVSHDLRTPLAVIKAAVSDLLNPDIALDEAARTELLRFIEGQSDRLSRLVVNILDMTRIRAGSLQPTITPTPVVDLLAAALASLPKEIETRVDSRLSDEHVVAVDHVLIAQVLANLLDNADRHAIDGSPIEVLAASVGAKIEISVLDHGPGIAAEDRDRIFDMFNRVSGAGRAGLGLTIAKAFVEAHGGTIVAENVPGGGAKFTFWVPAAP